MIAPEVLREIAAHARSTYPAECCGLLLQDRAGGIAFRPIANIAGLPEARATSGRTGRDGYVMEPRALLSALEEIETKGGRLWAIVHSHPDVGAYFSREDKDMALGGGAEPLWPGVRYLVVSVRKGRVDSACLYSWDAYRGDFSEEEVIGTIE
jgi:adenylyltransferase/sulfurtransferase